jgi:hypothetical protein
MTLRPGIAARQIGGHQAEQARLVRHPPIDRKGSTASPSANASASAIASMHSPIGGARDPDCGMISVSMNG